MKIGVTIPSTEQEQTGTTPGYAYIREYAMQAEAAGFDSIWVYDHLLFRHANQQATRGVWECWTLMSALAEATGRVQVGALVLCMPFRNPALLAKMAITLDEVSGGRLIVGLGAGWHKPEFDAFGYPFDHRVDRFEEALKISVPLLRGETVQFQGSYHAAEQCQIVPAGPRPNGPPVLIGASGPRMLRLTARYADMWNTCWYGTVDRVAKARSEMEAACREEGRDPATLEMTVGVLVAYPVPGKELPPADRALSGSPEAIAAQLRRYEQAGISQVICSIEPRTHEALGQFAEALRVYRG
jgi:probable F420-dependent oxidoreductase